MSTHNQSSLASEVFTKFDIPDHMTLDFLIADKLLDVPLVHLLHAQVDEWHDDEV